MSSANPYGLPDPRSNPGMFAEHGWHAKLVRNKKFGRHLVAKHDIKKGDLMGIDTPLFYFNSNPRCCSECGKELSVSWFTCEKHGNECPLKFCSRECRDWAWDHYHSAQDPEKLTRAIELVQQGVSSSRNGVLIVAKIAAMHLFPQLNQKAVKTMEMILTNVKDLHPGMEGQVSNFARMAKGIVKPGKRGNFDMINDERWLKKIFKACYQYSFGDLDHMSILGMTSWINHSCTPNASRSTFFPLCETVHATRDIQAGEQIFLSYIDVEGTPAESRRAKLEFQYDFVCDCTTCENGKELRCENCGKTGNLKKCTACKEASYCSKDCQKKHWGAHKRYCNMAKVVRTRQVQGGN